MAMQPEDLKALRKRAGLTQSELARELDLTPQYIGMMERGQKPIEQRTMLAIERLMPQFAIVVGGTNHLTYWRLFERETVLELPNRKMIAGLYGPGAEAKITPRERYERIAMPGDATGCPPIFVPADDPTWTVERVLKALEDRASEGSE